MNRCARLRLDKSVMLSEPVLLVYALSIRWFYSLVDLFVFHRLTTAGNLKAETEGTADLGYYLLPVYDKGKYQIRVEGPNGWAFDPPAVDIDIDGKDPCSNGRDINFDFRGFSIMGKVSRCRCSRQFPPSEGKLSMVLMRVRTHQTSVQ